jgi:hypothetical protein
MSVRARPDEAEDTSTLILAVDETDSARRNGDVRSRPSAATGFLVTCSASFLSRGGIADRAAAATSLDEQRAEGRLRRRRRLLVRGGIHGRVDARIVVGVAPRSATRSSGTRAVALLHRGHRRRRISASRVPLGSTSTSSAPRQSARCWWSLGRPRRDLSGSPGVKAGLAAVYPAPPQFFPAAIGPLKLSASCIASP